MAYFEENPQGISQADMIVAIPSFNEAEMIGYVTSQASQGLTEHFGHLKSVLINCDNHSDDGTKEAFMSVPTAVPKIYLSTPPNTPGKGNNLRNLFEKVIDLKARAVVIVDADVRSIAPQWIKSLGEPLEKGFGFVCPLYVRHKYESTLASTIAYPMTRCLYGRRVRQPLAGDFGFQGQLAEKFLQCPVWTESAQNYGINIWMSTVAINARLPICQAFMGGPKVHRGEDPFAQLTALFHQVVSTIFDLMTVYGDLWRQVKWSKPTALYGISGEDVDSPPVMGVNEKRLHERFLRGFDDHLDLWQAIFDQSVIHKLQEMRGLGLQQFSFPIQTWVNILFDAAAAYHQTPEADRPTLLDALLPIYMGKVLAFVRKTERVSVQQAEELVENECMVFEETKPYLLNKWV
ncbi:MAG TPA: glycosyl transferase [Syntrophobacteraceae bacterium]|nr:glycosyl transferase [Syntrophobacteraceae bacterium]